MRTFINDYKEPIFDKIPNNFNCKVKEQIHLKIVKETNSLFFARKYITFINYMKVLLKIPISRKIIKISGHIPYNFSKKKELNANIITVHSKKQNGIIKIKTFSNIENVFLKPIQNTQKL